MGKSIIELIGRVLITFAGLCKNCKCNCLCCKSSCNNKEEFTNENNEKEEVKKKEKRRNESLNNYFETRNY